MAGIELRPLLRYLSYEEILFLKGAKALRVSVLSLFIIFILRIYVRYER
jgi:hypothetical protein